MRAPKWWESEALGFDTETDGLLTTENRIVTASLVTLPANGKPTARNYVIDAGVEIPAEATAIHGITTEYARKHGRPPAEVLGLVSAELLDAISRSVPIIGMNIPFDLTTLHFDSLRNGVPTLLSVLQHREYICPVIDPLVLDKHVDPYRKGSRNLTALCAHYGVRHWGAHNSGYDALAAADVALAIAHKHEEIQELTLAELHAAQVQWKAEQNDSFQAYRRRTDPEFTLAETGWPIYDLAGGVS